MKTLTKKQFKIIDQLWMDRLDSGHLENDLEIIERHVKIAEKSYFDGKTPDEDNVKRISQDMMN